MTAPSDRRLAHDAAHIIRDAFDIHALVLGSAAIAACEYRIDGSFWQAGTCQSEAHRYADAGPEKGVLGTQLGPNRNGKKW